MATAMARTEAAAVVGGSSLPSSRHSLPPQSSRPALESAVDAYATRVLRMKSPPEASVDDSLGPYVTSIIRCSLGESASSDGPNAADVYDMDVEDLIEDFESLVELLEGHCGMSSEVAKSALHSIAISVKTGVVDAFEDGGENQPPVVAGSLQSAGILGTSLGSIISFDGSHGGGRLGRTFRSKSVGAVNDHEGMDAIQMIGDMLRGTDIVGQSRGVGEGGNSSPSDGNNDDFIEQPSFVMDEDIARGNNDPNGARYNSPGVPGVSALSTPQQSSNSTSPDQGEKQYTETTPSETTPSETPAITPMRLKRLIPEDLMGVLDNPATPAPSVVEDNEGNTVANSEITNDSNAAVSADGPSDRQSKRGKGKKKSKADAQDLAAALFRPSRARSNSVSQEKSPMLKPLSAPAPAMLLSSSSGVSSDLFQQQLDSATQILLSMNGSLGEDAATEAALVSNNDINVAQYVIDGALSAPPVCRHMLHDGCYRSDCHFSHEVEGHTCIFWLQGRCGKGESCRFMHGFSEKLLEGIKKDFLPDHHQSEFFSPSAESGGEGELPIQTANLVQHNMSVSSSVPKHTGHPFSFLNASQGNNSMKFGQMSSSLPKQSQFLGTNTPPASTVLQPSPRQSGPNAHPQGVGAQLESGNQNATESGMAGSASAWASVAQRGYSLTSFSPSDEIETAEVPSAKGRNKPKAVKIPQNLWNPSEKRCSSAFHIADPMERYAEVSATHPRKDVIDLHYQSVKTFSVVLSHVLPAKLKQHSAAWIIMGTGHHVSRNSHQKSGGVLESAVMSWLDEHGYEYMRGKDRNGYCGAVLVKQR